MRLENERTGEYRDIPTGFSFTTLFFGPFPMLFRGEIGYFFLVGILAILTGWLSSIFFAFVINGMCKRKLLEKGFRVPRSGQGSPGAQASDDSTSNRTGTMVALAYVAVVLVMVMVAYHGVNKEKNTKKQTQQVVAQQVAVQQVVVPIPERKPVTLN